MPLPVVAAARSPLTGHDRVGLNPAPGVAFRGRKPEPATRRIGRETRRDAIGVRRRVWWSEGVGVGQIERVHKAVVCCVLWLVRDLGGLGVDRFVLGL